MNINKLIKESHENAVEKGFYEECEWCENGYSVTPLENGEVDNDVECSECNGTGIDKNRNIPEMLMLIITEISEAVEALRCDKRPIWELYQSSIDDVGLTQNQKNKQFENLIKDTFEDEISDVFIRLFDLCGHLGIKIRNDLPCDFLITDNKTETLFLITGKIIELEKHISYESKSYMEICFEDVFGYLNFFCECNNIDIEKQIAAKMAYNKTRPKKHGKEF